MKKTGLYKRMVVLAIAPIMLLGVVILWFCYVRFISTMYSYSQENMEQIADLVTLSYDTRWPGDYILADAGKGYYDLYKGETNITSDNMIIDGISSKADCEISLLYMDMRVHTTFMTSGGLRFVGVYTNADTSQKVLAGESVFYKDIPILDDNYIVYYKPLLNSDGSVVGMIEIAKKSAAMKSRVLQTVWPILLLSLGGMIFAAFITYRNAAEIVATIKKIQAFLGGVASGDLQTELDISVLKRKDELGEIGKASTAMQRSIRGYVETDPLTQLGNRRYVNNMLEKIKNRAAETGLPFSVAIGDIDFFKKVNDTYGHNAGDEVLKAVAATLKRMMQGKGFAARWGGEEFIMVFDKMAMEEASEWLWRILENIREMVVSTEGFDIKVTMTFGVVTGFNSEAASMVELADEKLYYGKQSGRNRVVVELPEPEPVADEETSEEASCEQKSEAKDETGANEKPDAPNNQ